METIVSQKKPLYKFRIIGFVVLLIVFIYSGITYSLAHYQYSARQIYYLIALFLALVAVYVYKIRKGIVDQLIVSPEDIKIRFLYRSRQLTLKHTDVKAIYDLGGHAGSQGLMFNYKVQQLELNDGTFIEFADSKFGNYEELKAKLWEYRLLAYEHLRSTEGEA